MQNHAVGEQVRSARMIAFILGISIILIALVVPMDIFGMYYVNHFNPWAESGQLCG